VGSARDYTATPVAAGFSNLAVTLTRAKSGTWRAWFDDFVVNGKSSDANEKSGAIEFLSKDMKTVVFALRFQNMGILRVSRVPVAEGALELVQAELYFEKLSTGPQTAGGTQQSTSATNESEETTADGTSSVEENVDKIATTEGEAIQPVEAVVMQAPPPAPATGMLSAATTADTSGTTNVSVSDRFTSGDATVSDSTSTATRAGTVVGTTSTAVTNTNPADQGSRDPAGFPRVEGFVRVNFSGSYQSTYTQEQASYTSPEGIYVLVARVEAAAVGMGWKLSNFSESESSNGKSVSQQWTRPGGQTNVSYLQPPGGETKVTLSVQFQKPATN
jgi:hypothetical protein